MSDSRSDIEKYRKGELTSAEMHALEKRALSDPFFADALEGADSISPEDFSKDLIDIDQRFLSGKKKTIWFTPLRIAAGILLLIGSVFVVYTIRQPEEQLALQKEAPSPTPDTVAAKNESDLLSLHQPEEESKPDIKIVPKTQGGPTATTADGSGEAKPTAGLSTSIHTETSAADEQAKADQTIASELSEIASDRFAEREKIAATEPIKQDVKKESIDKDGGLAKARKSAVADDLQVQRIVRGQVISSEDGTPLPGVNVIIKGTTTGTVTDTQGNYSILLSNDGQQLVFSFIGLQTSEVSPANKPTVNVKLTEDIAQLSEVVVTGQGFNPDRDENETPVIKLAEPFGGRKAYDKYLENNLRYPQQALENKVKGRVTINFTVGTDGSLKDFSVLKSLGHGCDDEVIRLVKEGPKWTPSTEDNVAIESNVKVKMKFDPEKAKK